MSDRRAVRRRALVCAAALAAVSIVTSAALGHIVSAATVRCRPSQLRGATTLQGAAHAMSGGIVVTNHSHTACQLPLRPTVRLFHGTHVLAKRERAWSAWKTVGFSHAHVRVLGPGKRAYVILEWSGCSPWVPAPDTYFFADVELALAGTHGVFYAPLPDQITEYCPVAGQPSILSVSYFIPVP